MTIVAIISLFILQIISFYLLSLFYVKVSKFDELEKKQQKLIAQMDDSISVYLSELKDENERLITQLNNQQKIMKKTPMKNEEISPSPGQEKFPSFDINTPKIPINIALKSYKTINEIQETLVEQPVEHEKDNDKALAYSLHEAGKSIEEIAKALGKGRTEIELILKFR